ncbi:MAG: Uma2 family endonuclease [Myxacorys chilensis ATA2-1-KO14]|jgi:Uma2 family endonuclease|nr:Uma2 family endonuclease [Myxacorys chilensis ATA2-1-KO14]
MTLATYKWTIDHYHQAIDAGIFNDQSIELLRGELVLMPPEGPEHADSCETTARYLERLFGDGWWSRQGKPVTLADSEPQPDIAIVREQSYRSCHPTPKDIRLIVEYAYSTQAKDTGIKRDLYAEAGILDYLVIDLKRSSVNHYANPIKGIYTTEQTLTDGVIQVGQVQIEVQRLLRSAH